MKLPLAAGLAAALALSALGTGIAAAMTDPPAAAGAPAAAATARPDVPKTDGATAKGKDTDMVCVREEQTGTRLGGKRVCMTRSAYQQRAREAQEALDTLRKDPGTASK